MTEPQFAIFFLLEMSALIGFGLFFAEADRAPEKGRANMRAPDALIVAAIAGLALGVTWAILG